MGGVLRIMENSPSRPIQCLKKPPFFDVLLGSAVCDPLRESTHRCQSGVISKCPMENDEEF